MSNLELIFAGATETVPGSHYVLKHGKKRFAIDLGAVPNRDTELHQKLSNIYPLAPDISAFILTHGHYDHIGKLDKMVYKYGYRGPIFATKETLNILNIRSGGSRTYSDKINEKNETIENILRGEIGSSEKEFLELTPTRPDIYDAFISLTSKERAENMKSWSTRVHNTSIKNMKGLGIAVPYSSDSDTTQAMRKIVLDNDMTLRFIESSHVIGSAQLILKHKQSDGEKNRILFTGDLGYESDLFKRPAHANHINHMILDGTNANKTIQTTSHEIRSQIEEIINTTFQRGGQTYFGTFTLNRMQEIMNHIKILYKENKIPRKIPYFFNSPGGSKILSIYNNNPGSLKENGWNTDSTPFKIIGPSTRRSRASINNDEPSVVLAASGMFDCGRIISYLTKCDRGRCQNRGIEDSRNSIVLCGYQATETGQTLQQSIQENFDKNNTVNFLKKQNYNINAEVHKLDISGHADREMLLNYIHSARPKNLYLVHGEKESLHEFQNFLQTHKSDFPIQNVHVPKLYDIFDLD